MPTAEKDVIRTLPCSSFQIEPAALGFNLGFFFFADFVSFATAFFRRLSFALWQFCFYGVGRQHDFGVTILTSKSGMASSVLLFPGVRA